MRKSRVAVFFLVLTLSGFMYPFALSDFGESSTSLGQFTDEFTDLSNVSVSVNVVRNASLNAMELELSSMGLAGWLFRKSLFIDGTIEGLLTDYQIPIKVYFGDGVDGTETVNGLIMGKVYLNDTAQVDFEDVRFTGPDGSTVLDYWIEEKTDSDNAIMWAEVPEIPTSPGNTTIFIYWGNAAVSSLSNGQDTFIDFVQDNLTGFNIVNNEDYIGAAKPASDGTVTIVDGKISITLGNTAGRGIWLVGKTGITDNRVVVEFDNAEVQGDNWESVAIVKEADRTIGYRMLNLDGWAHFPPQIAIGNPGLGGGETWAFRRDDAPRYYMWRNGVAVGGNTAVDKFGADPFVFKVGLYLAVIGNGGTHVYNWIRVRKYVDPEPTFNIWGAVEEGFVDGYFTTENYLDQVNGSVLVQMTNATISGGAGITIQFSQDNSTWVNNLNAAGSNTLTAGFQSIDLRELNWSSSLYLRYNFTGLFASPPRLYQSRLITTLGQVGAGAPGLNVSGVWIDYNVSAINVSVGIVDGGNLSSVFFIDGNTFNVSEVGGVPGMVISMNFTGVDPDAECLWVTFWYLYDGNQNHDFDIEIWNFTSSAWVDDGHLFDGVAFSWTNSTIYAIRIPIDFLSGGKVRVQLNHESPGNMNHNLFIDYIRLVAKIPSGPAAGDQIINIIESDFPWIAIAIILMLVAYLLLSRLR